MKLLVLDGPLKSHAYPLTKPVHILGRDPATDIPLPMDALISRFHCQIRESGGSYTLEDMGSGNGTFLEGAAIRQPAPLVVEAIFRIGHTRLCLIDDATPGMLVLERLARAGDGKSTGAAPPGTPGAVVVAERPGVLISIDTTFDPDATRPGSGAEATADRLRTRLHAVQEVSEALAGKFDTAELLATAVDRIVQVLPAERAFALAVGDDGKSLQPIVIRRADGRSKSDLTVSRTLVDKVLRDRVAVIVHDTLSDEDLRDSKSVAMASMRSAMCVPLLHQGKVVALFLLDNSIADAFNREDLELVAAIANQAAVAVANTRLYEELRRAYQDLQTAHDQLVQSEKLSIIGTLAASMAHDIGNIITPMNGISGLLMRNPSFDPRLKDVFAQQMSKLKSMVQQLKAIARPRPPALLPTDLNPVVQGSVGMIQTEARHHNVEVVTELAAGLPAVMADPNRLDQVFVNLMVNSIQALGYQGGTITVRTGIDGEQVFASFSDTGPGIAAEHMEAIFKPFFTTKASESGTGLGLFSCRRIVEEEHKGKLTVASPPGEGAIFTVKLNRAGVNPPGAAPSP